MTPLQEMTAVAARFAEDCVRLEKENQDLREHLNEWVRENIELQRTLHGSHHLYCNYHNRRVGDCNCIAIMKGELKEFENVIS